MTRTFEQIMSEADSRLAEIEPIHREYLDLKQFLDIVGEREEKELGPEATPALRRRGRPTGTGNRHHQALRLLSDHGPMTVNEIAEHMGIKPNYLYRVLPMMQERGQVVQVGRRWDLAGPQR